MKKSLKFSLIINFLFMVCITLHSVNASANQNIVGNSSIKAPKKVIYQKPSKPVPKVVQEISKAPEKKAQNIVSPSKSTSGTVKVVQKKSTPAKTQNTKGSYKVASRGSVSAIGKGNPENIISYAKKFIGVKYQYGAMSPNGFDCSGFTSYVFKAFGISLPRTASGQATVGLKVSKDNLTVGDLVFFETYKKGISHVGIYVGGGKFIHASSDKGVTTSSLSDGYYLSRYRGGARILK